MHIFLSTPAAWNITIYNLSPAQDITETLMSEYATTWVYQSIKRQFSML